mmetsp:Transcript_27884/g.27746  ORF Transcript_27884/g.27746 Transcript_27884/m.27746 type:complete len:98 (-) Transcript_27884:356-649(-)
MLKRMPLLSPLRRLNRMVQLSRKVQEFRLRNKVVNQKLQKIENKDDIVIDDSEREIDGAQFEIHVENLDSIKNSSDARCEKNSKRLNRNVVIEEEIK